MVVPTMSSFTGPKVRDRSGIQYSYYGYNQVTPQNGNLPDIPYEFRSSTSRKMTDVAQTYKVEGWQRLKSLGIQCGAPYDRMKASCEVSPGSATVRWKYTGTTPNKPASITWQGCNALLALSVLPTTRYIEADNQALVRFYSAIRAEYQHMQSLIAIGELGETVRMLRRPFAAMQGIINGYLHDFDRRGKSTLTFYRKRRRNKIPQWTHLNNAAAEAWLEASFGIRPLVADVVGIAETLARALDNGSDRRTQVQGFGTSTGNGGITVSDGNQVASYIYTRETFIDTTTWKVKYRAGVNSAMSGPDGSLYRLRSLAGWTPEEFVPTVWNLLPWSFLADYFFNVGAVLGATWTNTSAVTWAIKSDLGVTERRYDSQIDHKAIKAALGNSYISSSGDYAWRIKATLMRNTRTILDPASLPLPMYDSKSFDDWNPIKVGNILALLKTKARGISHGLLTTSRG